MAISQRDLSGKEEEEKDNHYDQDRRTDASNGLAHLHVLRHACANTFNYICE
jgi:hypothetical protein